ncbi:MAG: hypothetical protein ACJASN_003110 [Cyclobacteriaceae bacterium]|jgi:hypothetical protein
MRRLSNCFLLTVVFVGLLLLTKCDSSSDPELTSSLSELKQDVVQYFTEVALGSENGNSSEIVRKWGTAMRIFVGGEDADPELLAVLEETITIINGLSTDGFEIDIVTDSIAANTYLYFGIRERYLDQFPNHEASLCGNLALFYIWWQSDRIFQAQIFINVETKTFTQQRSLILEEVTQSLGLGKDSLLYKESIFYETSVDGRFAQDFADIDLELIRLLYNPRMRVGLDRNEVVALLSIILLEEQENV